MNNVTSPRTDDAGIEQEIIAKGLTAPRVTPADIEANIYSEHYFTAIEGAVGRAIMANEDGCQGPEALELLTFCVLTLQNGFTVVGQSACASKENFNADIGKKIARANAVNNIWPLMGYELRTQLNKEKPTE
jgi:Phage protein (N4 Gp49/phage Sf6 gene 66) family